MLAPVHHGCTFTYVSILTYRVNRTMNPELRCNPFIHPMQKTGKMINETLSDMDHTAQIFEFDTSYIISLPYHDLDPIQKQIMNQKRPTNQALLEDMALRLKRDDLVIDIGAKFGNNTLFLAAVLGCKVISFEPHDALKRALDEGVRLNGLEASVEVNRSAVGNTASRGRFSEQDLNDSSFSEIEDADDDSLDAFDIVRLDDRNFSGKKPRAILITTNGMELPILEGGKNLIKSCKPVVYVDCVEEKVLSEVNSWLSQQGYNYWETFPGNSLIHLFLHNNQVTSNQRFNHLLFKLARNEHGFNRQISNLKEKLENTNSRYQRLKEEVLEHKFNVGIVTERYNAGLKNLKVLEQQLAEEKSSHKDTKQQALEASQKDRQEIDSLRQQVTVLQKNIDQATAELSISMEQKKLTVERLDEANLKYRTIDVQMASLRQRLDSINEKYQMSTEQVNTLKMLLASERGVWQEETNRLRKDHQSVFTQLEAEKDSLTKQNEQLENQLTDQIKRARSEQEANELHLEKLAEENQRLLHQLKHRETEHAHTQDSLNEISGSHKELVNHYRQDQVKLHELEKLLKEANEKYREVTSEQIPLLKKKLSEATTINDQQRKEIQELIQQQHKWRIQNQKLENRLRALRSSTSFQLGYSIVTAVVSRKGLLGFPRSLWSIGKAKLKARTGKRLIRGSLEKSQVSSGEGSHRPILPSGDTDASLLSKKVLDKKANPVSGSDESSKCLRKLRVAGIMDEFTFGSYEPECDLCQLTPSDWKSELESFQPALLFVESAWRGKDDLWGSKVGHTSSELQDIVNWCRQHAVPTVFWNKEDPVHFQTFLNSAKLFDHVFTTDIDCIHRYKSALGHDRVYLLPFACQPRTHNPLELYERKNAISFAGAYYVRYPERTRDLGNFLSSLPSFCPVEIYDRNFGKQDPNYQFPAEYQPYIVGTLPFDKIDLAYKGYRYAINLNSIKQSQTMFARRVFELLASNTITISNFSRGIRLLLGDLVVTSDDGDQIVKRLHEIADDDEKAGKLKLAALRKVMMEHTYQQRLGYIYSKVTNSPSSLTNLPAIVVLAQAATQREADLLVKYFLDQTLTNARLTMVIPYDVKRFSNSCINYLDHRQADSFSIFDIAADSSWIAGMIADDYYGPNYLLDIALATFYSDAKLIGKSEFYDFRDGSIYKENLGLSYRATEGISFRRGAMSVELVGSDNISSWLSKLSTGTFLHPKSLSIDPYNYCQNGSVLEPMDVRNRIDDLPELDTGLSIQYLQELAEKTAPSRFNQDKECLTSDQLAVLFNRKKSKNVRVELADDGLLVNSGLKDGKHEYLYAIEDLVPDRFLTGGQLKFYIDITPGLTVSLVVLFLDEQKQRINHVIFQPNQNVTSELPADTRWLRFGLRVLSGGEASIKSIVIGHRDLQPATILGKAQHLLITNNYPAYGDLYRNGFVHSRVKAYAQRNCSIDVFRVRSNHLFGSDEFEGIDVLTGDPAALDKMLARGLYKSILVHFLSPEMWNVLERYVKHVRVVVWVHGAEIHPWYRREYNYLTEQDRNTARIESDKRMAFWKNILNSMPANLHMVFVSNSFASEVFEDLGFELLRDQYSIIHNPIDTGKFNYHPKPVEQRKKILSIRPFASRQYANDLTVKVILELAKKPFFEELEFRIIGDGKLFEQTVEPLLGFPNVTVERRFLNHQEITTLHKQFGVFLCPTRWDSQGVSRDEAMSSGLVPVTNAVAAVPEFVDDSCGILAPAEDFLAMVTGIEKLFNQPEFFSQLSKNATERVRCLSGHDSIIQQELALFTTSDIAVHKVSL